MSTYIQLTTAERSAHKPHMHAPAHNVHCTALYVYECIVDLYCATATVCRPNLINEKLGLAVRQMYVYRPNIANVLHVWQNTLMYTLGKLRDWSRVIQMQQNT